VFGDVARISSRFHCGREDRVVGSLAAGGIAQSDWASVWQAVIVYLLPVGPARRDSSGSPTSLAVGIDGLRARGDIERHCGTSIGTIADESRTCQHVNNYGHPIKESFRHHAPPPCAGVKVKPCGCCATLTPLAVVARLNLPAPRECLFPTPPRE
jgi:hypothetical protein